MARLSLTDDERRQLTAPASGPPVALSDRSADEADLSGIHRVGGRFVNVSFVHANLTGARFEDVTFDDCDFSGAHVSAAVFRDVRFNRCLLKAVDGEGTSLDRCRLTGCDLSAVRIERATIRGCAFVDASGEDAVLRTSAVADTALSACRLDRPKVELVDLERVTADGCALTHFKFTEGTWADVRFTTGTLDDGGVDRVRIRRSAIERLERVRAVRFFGGGIVDLRLSDCQLLDDVGFDSVLARQLQIERCRLVRSLLLLTCDVAAVSIVDSRLEFLDVSETTLQGPATFAKLVLAGGTSFVESTVTGLAIDQTEIGGWLRQDGSTFDGVRATRVRYAPDFKRVGAAPTVTSGDRLG